MRTRPYDWIEFPSCKRKYGIQVRHQGIWMNYAINGELQVFDTHEEREECRKRARRLREDDGEIVTGVGSLSESHNGPS